MTKTTTALAASTLGALVLPLAALHVGVGPLDAAKLAIFGAALGQLAIYDLLERRIPNRIVLPAAAACAALSIADGVRPSARLLVAVGLVVALFAVSLSWPAALGMGDVKLALLLVCALGGLASTALLLTLMLNALVGVLLLARHGRMALRMKLPFAPFTAAGCVLVLLL
jgi:leader peptidase (prepilin peptidase) / N-methyltransferase